MKDLISEFKEGQYVYCSRVPGIHKILRVYPDQGKCLLVTEHLYNEKYDKVSGKQKDREYNIDSTFCRIINFVALLNYETSKYDKICEVINKLKSY